MKTIYIVRHAKSSWADLLMKDIDRPLNERGRRDAPVMSSKCMEHQYIPELIITSNAKRAQETSMYFIEKFGLSDFQIQVNPKLYHAPEDTYFEEAQLIDDLISTVMMFGHNPGITYLANSVSENYIDNVPTCGVLAVHSTAKTWSELDPMNSKLMNFIYPKMF
ncbi:MAG: phosphohistidine phosphatase [Saprospiraceae bacterium]|jgi:phosphohistidine phosphatase